MTSSEKGRFFGGVVLAKHDERVLSRIRKERGVLASMPFVDM
jgi:hypothetical protein